MKEVGSKDRIRRAAMKLFVERGVDAVSMRDIAEAVDLKVASLYSHFANREDLIGELFCQNFAEYGQRLSEAAATPGHFMVKLAAMIHVICQLHEEDELLFSFLLLTQHAHLRQVARDDNNPVEIICQSVKQAMQRGEIRDLGSPELLAAGLIGVVVQAATFRLYGRIQERLSDMETELFALCLRMVS